MSVVPSGALSAEATVDLTGGNTTLVVVVLVIALVALAMAFVFRAEVLRAGEGTEIGKPRKCAPDPLVGERIILT